MPGLQLVADSPVGGRFGLPPLIVRLGLHDQGLLTEFEGFGMGVVGRTIAQAKADRALGRRARDDYGLELLVDCDTWQNQLRPADRAKSFLRTELSAKHRLDIPRRQLTREEEGAYVRATLQELVWARATILVAPYHLGGGPECPIRQLDLRLARRAALQFRAARLDEPPEGERFPVERRIIACVAIRAADLVDGGARAMLVHLYRAVPVDGYLLKPEGFSETSSRLHAQAVAEFAFSLHLLSGRDVILGGGKNLAEAFVAAGLPAAMLGIGEGELFGAGAARRHGKPPTYYSPLIRSIRAHGTTPGAAYRATIVFTRYPCTCGHHPGTTPPTDERERKFHTCSQRLQDFAVAGAVRPNDAVRWLERRTRDADAIAEDVGYPACPSTHVLVGEVAQRVRHRIARSSDQLSD